MMRYHLVISSMLGDLQEQIRKQAGFVQYFLSDHAKDGKVRLGEIYCLAGDWSTAAPDRLEAVAKPEDLYIFGSDEQSTQLAVRLAKRMKGSSVTEVHALHTSFGGSGEKIHVKKMLYSNHMEGVFEMNRGPYCISLSRESEAKSNPDKKNRFVIPEVLPAVTTLFCEVPPNPFSQEWIPEEEGKKLEQAKIVLVAGRGIGSRENMNILKKTAEYLGAEIALSRPAAMNAWGPMERLLGVSGSTVCPAICITVGVSGAAAFFAGIEGAEWIAAINREKDAPVMKMADVSVEEDCIPFLEELNRLLEQHQGKHIRF